MSFRSNNEWEKAAKLSFIENQIHIAKSINSTVELEHWYGILGLHLAEHGTETKVRMLLDTLVGVPNGSNQGDDTYLVSVCNTVIWLYMKLLYECGFLLHFREFLNNDCCRNCWPVFSLRRAGNESTLNIRSSWRNINIINFKEKPSSV